MKVISRLASDVSRFRRQLSQLKVLLEFEKDNELDESQCKLSSVSQNRCSPLISAYIVFASCEKVFLFIDENQRLNFGVSISEEAREGKMNSSTRWLELRHFLGRLHSYHLAVETMLRARRLWDRLWDEIKVTAIPSATAIPHPLNKKRPIASELIGRLTSDQSLLDTYQARAEKLQELSLDETMLTECNSPLKTHVVHAEVLVLDYVLGYLQDAEDTQFCDDLRYIGSSKPTCRLCYYYFISHSSGIQVRETHDNLYSHWRAPDVFDENAMTKMERHLHGVIVRTRADAIRSLMSPTLKGRKYDSNSFSNSLSELPSHFASHTTETSPISDLESKFSALDVITEEEDRSASKQRKEEEEEEYIKPLFKGRWSVSSRR
jgi:hypothetical protein